MDTKAGIVTPEINFPKGGGAIKGMGEVLSSGYLGMASLTIPLPFSPARALTPNISLNYLSSAGNGPFGIGFYLNQPSFARRTKLGAPNYEDDLHFLAPDGELLVAPEIVVDKSLQGKSYQVTRFYSRNETTFAKIEYWLAHNKEESFWHVYQSDGSQHIYGKTAEARIADPQDVRKIFRWFIEESVAVNGEHVYYEYKSENKPPIESNLTEKNREHTANRYLKRIHYANQEGYAALYLLSNKDVKTISWLFHLIFDYGEHTPIKSQTHVPLIPSYEEQQTWLTRQDPFSEYSAGFEIRCHRLCRRVLMFHEFPEWVAKPILVNSLELTYHENPIASYLECVHMCYYQQTSTKKKVAWQKQEGVPLEFNFSNFSLTEAQFTEFDKIAHLPGLNSGGIYQLVDLYGEGIPGILYSDGNSYLYRSPQRANLKVENSDAESADAITYSDWQPLPGAPSFGLGLAAQQSLMDLTGDGRLELVNSIQGISGFFSLDCKKNWHHFIPFSSFPSEFNHPRSYLADIVGAGLSDLVLIGPNSVRLYANQREYGFAQPIEVVHGEPEPLPSAPSSTLEVIAFSDVLGSGQQHLVRVRHNEVVCWPNLGRGQFGKAIQLTALPFARDEFSADRVFLVDVDGSGATDLIYVMSDRLKIFLNQSGNGFAEASDLLFPKEIHYDNLTQLSFADVLGTGTACLVLTQTHTQPRHWIYAFNKGKKAYLLTQTNNNRGLNTTLEFRCSAQEWLDEKKEKPDACSYLPFPVHVVSTIKHEDEITGNSLKQRFKYRQGYYDGRDREFRGFAYVSQFDCENFIPVTQDTKSNLDFVPPVCTKTWYHTGNDNVQDKSDDYLGDNQAITLGDTLYLDRQNQPLTELNESLRSELARSLQGKVRRQEVFGLDSDVEKGSHPYTVSSFRYFVRLQREKTMGQHASLYVGLLEQVSYQYDRQPQDPQCQQFINLNIDTYGVTTEAVTINYPRRGDFTTFKQDPLFDEEQFKLRLSFAELSVTHLDKDPNFWRLALPTESKTLVNYFPLAIPKAWQGALSYERFHENNYMTTKEASEITSWMQYYYYSAAQNNRLPLGEVSLEGLMYQTLTAEIKQAEIRKILTDISKSDLEEELLLKKGKYIEQAGYYWIPSDLPSYAPLKKFFSLIDRTDPFGVKISYQYDAAMYSLTTVIDPLGFKTIAKYDYRLLTPIKITDPNDYTEEVFYDIQGRVRTTSFYGQEQGKKIGFSSLEDYQDPSFTLEEALKESHSVIGDAASLYFYDNSSWRLKLTPESVKNLVKNDAENLSKQKVDALIEHWKQDGMLTEEGYLKNKVRWLLQKNISILNEEEEALLKLAQAGRLPCHSAVFVADNYPNVHDRKIRISVTYSDGFGRVLQSKQLVPSGQSYLADAENGLTVAKSQLVEEKAEVRWAVSGRTEYNNKGLAIRQYQPYFIDTYRYIQDAALRQYAYYDTVFYDPLGRVLKIVNAAGFFRRNTYHPWYLKQEDENDTWAEVLEASSDK